METQIQKCIEQERHIYTLFTQFGLCPWRNFEEEEHKRHWKQQEGKKQFVDPKHPSSDLNLRPSRSPIKPHWLTNSLETRKQPI